MNANNITITPAMLKSGVLTEESPGNFRADASDLGIPPGRFPIAIGADFGNGMPLMLRNVDDNGTADYLQIASKITLSVFND